MSDKFDDKLQARNIKLTAMRQLVLEVLTEEKAAISLPELEDRIERADKTTLYRTLKKFEENKLIHKIDDGTGAVKYALCQDTCTCSPHDLHVHFHCTKCNKTYCLNDIPVPEMKLPTGFTLDRVNLVVEGLCANCTIE